AVTLYRLSENFTSLGVSVPPLLNLAPLRSVKSYTRPSGAICHDSAMLGAIGLPGIAFTSASWIAYMTMNGVMIPWVSAGSNHVGASEMWTPHVIWPSGVAAAGVTAARAATASNAISTQAARRR